MNLNGIHFHFIPKKNNKLLRRLSFLLIPLLFVAFIPALLPPYGLTGPEAIGPYLNGTLPPDRPSDNTNFDAEIIYPNLTFNAPVTLREDTLHNVMYVAEKRGRIVSFIDDQHTTSTTTVLDIESHTSQGEGTNGLTGFILHPEFGQPGSPNRGYFYVWHRYIPDSTLRFTDTIGYRRLVRYEIPDGSSVADPNSETVLINQFARSHIHGGGGMFFGPEGFLYLGLGDEGLCCEQNSTQRIDQWFFGGVLRLDVDMDSTRSHPIRRQPISNGVIPLGWPNSFSANYYVPDDNPWIDAGGAYLEEFYAIGIRHAYTLAYDPVRGEIWEGDIGELTYEEINKIEKGANYEWPFLEAGKVHLTTLPYGPVTLNDVIGTRKSPLISLDRGTSNGVIAGGVYRGANFPGLFGKFIFADHAQATIYSVDADAQGPMTQDDMTLIASIPGSFGNYGISNFYFTPEGEIYLLKMDGINSDGGRIYRITTQGTPNPEPPALLSQTGAFADLATLTPAQGIIPYKTNAPLWSDAAEKLRWIAIPNDGSYDTADEDIVFNPDGPWGFPEGSVFIKHFELPVDANNPDSVTRLETRFIVMGPNSEYYGVTYRWYEDGSDAYLLTDSETRDVKLLDANGDTTTQIWTFPSRINCISCHTSASGGVLGVNTQQLNGDFFYPGSGVEANMLESLNHIGIFDQDIGDVEEYVRNVPIGDSAGTLEMEIRSYLDGNCASCHFPNGVEGAFDARIHTPIALQSLISASAIGPNSNHPYIIDPGDPQNSELWVRDNSNTNNLMPPIGRILIDQPYIDALTEWINGLEPSPADYFTVGEFDQISAPDGVTAISFDRAYSDPVVLIGPGSNHEATAFTVRAQNLNSSGFDLLLQEWGCDDGTHVAEEFAYLALEAGVHILPNGKKLIAGNTLGVSDAWTSIGLPDSFDQAPLIFAQLSSGLESDPAIVQINPQTLSTTGFELRLQEQEGNSGHVGEQVSWVAVEAGTFDKSGAFETGVWSGVNSSWTSQSSQLSFSGDPLIFASIASLSESDPASIRFNQHNQTNRRVDLQIQEEACGDAEQTHGNEQVFYLLFERSGFLYSQRDPSLNQAPVVSLLADSQGGMAPKTINFDGSGSYDPDNDPITYLWDFGDGTQSTEAQSSHTFTQEGTYEVVFQVTDILDYSAFDTVSIVITPNADTTAPTLPGNFTASFIGVDEITLDWLSSVDTESGVAGYRVYQDSLGVTPIETQADSLSIGGLDEHTTYQFWISAFDVAGNESAPVGPLAVQTQDGAPEACLDVVNLALGKPAEQSSVYGFGVASIGVDGDTDGSRGPWGNASIVHTLQEENPWWQVDLESMARIQSIRIFNRTDCCGNRLNSFYLLISPNPFSPSASLNDLLIDPEISVIPFVGTAGDTLDFNMDEEGRYVRIQLSSTAILNFAEIEIIGCNSSTCLNPPVVNVVPQDAQTCGGLGTVSLNASPGGGNWTLEDEFGNQAIHPDSLLPGTYFWEYAFFNCAESGSFTISEPETPLVSIDPAGPFYANAPIQYLSANPIGGVWTGDVAPDGAFDPSLGEGIYQVYYSYTNIENCNASDTLSIAVIPAGDSVPPSVPQNLSTDSVGYDFVTIQWEASTDTASGVAMYFVYLDGSNTPVDTVLGPIATLGNLEPGTNYQVAISAIDYIGNESAQSGGYLVSTLSCATDISVVLVSDVSECDQSNGSFDIYPATTNLEYSIDSGLTYQTDPFFTGLAYGTYPLRIRVADYPSCFRDTTIAIGRPLYCEFTACNSLENLALGKTASQSSTYGAGTAAKAVDGNRIGSSPWTSDLQHTQNESQPWLKIDLEDAYFLDSLYIFNRTNCCQSRLKNFFVFTSENDFDLSRTLTDLQNDNSITHQYFAGNAGVSEILDLGHISGRYMGIKLSGSGILHLAEVEVMGCELTTPCLANINSIFTSNISDCGLTDGTISILATGDSLEYSIDGGLSYQDTNYFAGLDSGRYSIFVREVNSPSCEVVDSVSLSAPAVPTISSAFSTDISDCGLIDGTITILASGDSLEYSIDGGLSYQDTNYFAGLDSGRYSIFVREVNSPSCEVVDSVSLSAPAVPTISSAFSTDISDCGLADGTITILATGDSLEYSIDGGLSYQDTNYFAGLDSGRYSIYVREVNSPGCEVVDSVSLSAPAVPTITSVLSTDISDCGLTDGTISILATGDSLEYSIDGGLSYQDTNYFAGLDSGRYSIYVREVNSPGCEVVDSVSLSAPAVPTITSVIGTDISDCGLIDGTITILASGDSLEYSIDGGLSYQDTNYFAGLDSGRYSIYVREVNSPGCEVVDSVSLSAPAVPTITSVLSTDISDCGLIDGTITIIASGDSLEYSIDGGLSYQDTNYFAGLDSGRYSIFVREINSASCEAVDSVSIAAPHLPLIISVLGTDPTACGLVDGSITIQATGDSLEYSIDGSLSYQDTNYFAGLDSGRYSIYVREVNSPGCEVVDSVSLSAPAVPTITSVLSTDISDCGLADGTITILATGDSLEYSIDGGLSYQDTNYFPGLDSGVYSIYVREVNSPSCEVVDSVSLSAPVVPTITSVIGTDISDCGLMDGTITILASGDSLEYSIDGGLSYQDTNYFAGLDSGRYSIFVREVNSPSCEVVDSVSLSAPAVPTISSAFSTDISDCGLIDGTITIIASGDSLEYSIDGGLSYQDTNYFAGLDSGRYSIFVREINSASCEAVDSVSIAAPHLPLITSVLGTDPTACGLVDGSITIQATGDSLEYSIDGGLSYQDTNYFAGLDSGRYSIYVREVNSPGCEVVDSVSLSAPAVPTIISVLSTDISDCGLADGTITILATGDSLEYSIDGGLSYQDTNYFPGLDSGVYSIYVREVNSPSCEVVDSVSLSAPVVPTITSVLSTDISDCGLIDGTITILASGDSLEYSIDGGLSYQDTNYFAGLDSGRYSIFVREVNSPSCEVVDSVSLSAPAVPTISSAFSTDISDCGLIDGTITIIASGDSLEYSIDGGLSYQDTNYFAGLDSGRYSIFVREINSASCEAVDSVSIAAPHLPLIISVLGTDPTACGLVDGSITIQATGDSLEYSIDGSLSYQDTNYFAGLDSGVYSIYVREVNSPSCEVVDSVSLSAPAVPTITSVLSTDISDCGLADGTITILATGDSLEYSIDGGLSYQDTNYFAGLDSGVYSIYVREVNSPGCEVVDSVSLSAPAVPTITSAFSTDISDCGLTDGTITILATGDSLEYSIDGGLSYQDTNYFSGLDSGRYSIYVREVNSPGCEVVDSVSLSAPAVPTITSAFSTDISDCGLTDGTITIIASGDSLEYSIDGGLSHQDTNHFAGLDSGRYSIFVREINSASCEAVDSVSIAAPHLPLIISVLGTDPTACGLVDGSITIQATGDSLEYSIDGGLSYQDTNYFAGLDSGRYSIYVREVNSPGCEVVDSVSLSAPAVPTIISVLSTDISDCGLADGTITILATGDSLEYSIDGGLSYQDTNYFPGLDSGVYSIYVREVNSPSCEVVDSVSLSAPVVPTITSVLSTDISDCGLIDGTITILASGDSLEYSIDGGLSYQDTNYFAGLDSGRYSIFVREVNSPSCEVVDSVSLSAPAVPTITSVIGTDISDCGLTDGTITIIASGDSLEYSIDGGTSYFTTHLFTGLDSGYYSIYVRNPMNSGCEISTNTRLTRPHMPEITALMGTNPSECGAADGTITIGANGSNLAYSIDNGLTFQSQNFFSGLAAGTYQVVAKVDTYINCVVIDSVSIQDPGDCGECAGSTNLALNKTASQSSTYGLGSAGLAVDGSRNGSSPWTPDLQHTNSENAPWWKVDLESSAKLDSILIFNRSNCCQNRLKDFNVYVSELDMDGSLDHSTLQADSNINSFFFSGVAGIQEFINLNGISGQFIMIKLSSGTQTLHMAEVEVYGCYNLGSNPTCDIALNTITPSPVGSCGANDGTISIDASGSFLEYSLDAGQSFQPSPYFSGLSTGTYFMEVRQFNNLSCRVLDTVILAEPANCSSDTCATPINLALGKVASQSSTYGNGEASIAIDGTTSGDSPWGASATLQHTHSESEPWWKIDLGVSSTLTELQIFNRTNCCQSRLGNFYVFISNVDLDASRPLADLLSDADIQNIYFPDPAGLIESIALNNIQGRYLVIKLAGTNRILHVAEIEVYGCAPPQAQRLTNPNEAFSSETEPYQMEVEIVPNPFVGQFEMNIRTDIAEELTVSIFNSLGQQIAVKNLQTNVRTNWGKDFPAGVYYVHITGKEKRIIKVIKVM